MPSNCYLTLIEPGDRGVLRRQVRPRRRRVLHERRHRHILRPVERRLPVRNPAVAGEAVAETLAEVPELRVRVPAAVRVVRGEVEEEGQLLATFDRVGAQEGRD